MNCGFVTLFPPLSLFVMVMLERKPLARLGALNPDSPAASTSFVANSRFVPATLPVGRRQ